MSERGILSEAKQIHERDLIDLLPDRCRNSSVDFFFNLNSVSFCHLDDVGNLDKTVPVFAFDSVQFFAPNPAGSSTPLVSVLIF